MLTEKKQSNLLFWSFLSLYAYELVFQWPKLSFSASNLFALLYISLGCMIVLYRKTSWKQDIPPAAQTAFYLLLACNVVAVIRGILNAKGYVDLKNTLTDADGGLALLLPITMMAGLSFLNGYRLLRLCITIFTFSFVLIPVALSLFPEMYSRLVTPVIFFILLIPYVKGFHKFVILIVAVVSALIAVSWRANILQIGLGFLFLLIYYFRQLITKFFLTILQIAFFVVPLYFLYQGTQGDSIFANDDSQYNVMSNGEEVDLIADTRTALYDEVLNDLVKNNSLWLGKGSTGKYETEYDFELLAELGNERPNVEVGFLKILIQTGILGMILYGIVLGIAVYFGTQQTNNTLTKLLAVFLAFHWTMLFIESTTVYDPYFYFSWIAVGLCFSKKFRNLTDGQIREWLHHIR